MLTILEQRQHDRGKTAITAHRAPVPGGGEFGRGARVDVRNPIVLMPEAQALAASLSPLQRQLFGRLMRAMAAEANKNAEAAWKKRKGPMAAYWRAGCTYMKHIARAIDPRSR